MKIALFGGSFNPIHTGHLQVAHSVLKELHYQKIIFMPAFFSPFKTEDVSLCSPLDRLNMVKEAIKGEQRFECSPYEIQRAESSFTINTVEHLYSLYGENGRGEIEGKLGLIIGSDQLLQFKKWKDYEKILQLCQLLVARREKEFAIDKLNTSLDETLQEIDFDFTLLKTPISPISSSTIRNIIKEEQNWKKKLKTNALSEKVSTYIEENALYGSSFKAAFKFLESLICDVREYAKSELSEKRFLHSMRVADMAEHLAKTYPQVLVPPRLAYLAGIAHDITKEKSDAWQKKTIEMAGESIDEVERAHLRLLHGRTAAILLKEYFYIRHRSLLDAIKNHTFAHPLLDHLGKILYIADKIEEARRNVEDVREMIGFSSIDEIMIVLLERGEKLLKAKNASPHQNAIKLLSRLKKN